MASGYVRLFLSLSFEDDFRRISQSVRSSPADRGATRKVSISFFLSLSIVV